MSLPVLGGVGLALIFFFLQKDLGPALMLSCVFLALYAVARGGVGAAAGAAARCSWPASTPATGCTSPRRWRRACAMWQAPWDNTVRGGDQVAQAVWALATGGVFGTGLGLGETRYLPAGQTDLALAAVGEELGPDRAAGRGACSTPRSRGAASASRCGRPTTTASSSARR